MNKLLTILTILFLAANTAQAFDYVSDTMLLDGSHVKQCRLADGSIDYCTDSDRINAKRAFANPELTSQQRFTRQQTKVESTLQGVGHAAHILNTAVNDVRAISAFAGLSW